MVVEIAEVELPYWLLEIMRAQTKRALDCRHALLAAPEVHLPKSGIGNGVGIIGIVSDRRLGFRDGRPEFMFVLENPRPCHMRPGIMGTKRQGRVSCFLGALKIAGRIVAPTGGNARLQRVRQA